MCFMMSEFEWYPRLLLEYDTVRLPQAGFGTLLNWILPRILRGVEILFNRSKANMSANNTRNKISDNVYVKVGKQSQFELRKDNWGQGRVQFSPELPWRLQVLKKFSPPVLLLRRVQLEVVACCMPASNSCAQLHRYCAPSLAFGLFCRPQMTRNANETRGEFPFTE